MDATKRGIHLSNFIFFLKLLHKFTSTLCHFSLSLSLTVFVHWTKALSGNFDDLMPPPERYIFNFNSKKELTKWHLYSDSEYGGALFLPITTKLLNFGYFHFRVFYFFFFLFLHRFIFCITSDNWIWKSYNYWNFFWESFSWGYSGC